MISYLELILELVILIPICLKDSSTSVSHKLKKYLVPTKCQLMSQSELIIFTFLKGKLDKTFRLIPAFQFN